jgi:hypothetical protein
LSDVTFAQVSIADTGFGQASIPVLAVAVDRPRMTDSGQEKSLMREVY